MPIVLGGTDELFRGRRFRLEILEPVTWQDLAGVPPGSAPPEPWSSAERRVAHRVAAALHERDAPRRRSSARTWRPSCRRPGTRKRWRWLTTAWH